MADEGVAEVQDKLEELAGAQRGRNRGSSLQAPPLQAQLPLPVAIAVDDGELTLDLGKKKKKKKAPKEVIIEDGVRSAGSLLAWGTIGLLRGCSRERLSVGRLLMLPQCTS